MNPVPCVEMKNITPGVMRYTMNKKIESCYYRYALLGVLVSSAGFLSLFPTYFFAIFIPESPSLLMVYETILLSLVVSIRYLWPVWCFGIISFTSAFVLIVESKQRLKMMFVNVVLSLLFWILLIFGIFGVLIFVAKIYNFNT